MASQVRSAQVNLVGSGKIMLRCVEIGRFQDHETGVLEGRKERRNGRREGKKEERVDQCSCRISWVAEVRNIRMELRDKDKKEKKKKKIKDNHS